jgi:hypothetical protein
MSSYLNIYFRPAKADKAYYLTGYCRSNSIYETFYESLGTHVDRHTGCCLEMNADNFANWLDEIYKSIKSYKNNIEEYTKSQEFLKQTNAPIGDIMEYYNDYQRSIDYCKEELAYLEETAARVRFLIMINEEHSYDEKNGTFFYIGIDGGNPTNRKEE